MAKPGEGSIHVEDDVGNPGTRGKRADNFDFSRYRHKSVWSVKLVSFKSQRQFNTTIMETGTATTNSAVSAAINWKEKIGDYVLLHSGGIIGAIVIVFAGFLAAGWLSTILLRALERKHLEPPIRMLISRIVKILVLLFTFAIAAQTMGINLLPLIAGVSVVGVGAGLAMQGVLSNLVAGLVIIFTKKFRVGEFIEIHGVNGQVAQIELFSTTLIHADRSRIIIPNRKIIGEILHNFGTIRQVDLSIGVGYGTDLTKLQSVVQDILNRSQFVLKDPAPVVAVTGFGDSSVNVAIKPWVTVDHFGAAQADLNRAILESFRQAKIEIPFPQREIRVLGNANVA